ncbi:D-3-phosphoglycerate dehydrogenase-like [Limulus polyphemus]|uniref:D-3-phosphoglycerate dehydrogenase n=1 Tax=Limulus polyphemus TaxID=6850 RepID=A0ABM1C5Y3_LIMPO|nr:D-3-phosphoglycerate dehydrogenase-like [Limulus polyphemus]
MVNNIRSVLISENVDSVCAKILRENGFEVTNKIGMTRQELLDEVKKYDSLIVRSATKVTADVIEAATSLKVIGRAGTGVDNIDCDAATRQGILVINAPGGNTLSAAELTCCMVVSLSRKIAQACASLKAGLWDRKTYIGEELQGKTLAIIGLGRIGREVASRMQSFGMKTIGFDPLVPPEESITFGVESFQLDQLWPKADYITIHVPLIPPTKHMINDLVLSKCRKGVKIVNCARGGIIDEDALLRALESEQCGGAGLDVFEEEPPKNSTLLQHSKVICTPHLGASTKEAQKRVAEEIALQFVELLKGHSVPGIVNAPTFGQFQVADNKYWVKLCQTLGKLADKLVTSDEQKNVIVSTRGALLEKKGTVLGIATLVGLMSNTSSNGINFINAPLLAKEAGIKLSIHHKEVLMSCDGQCPSSAVEIKVEAGNESHVLVGTTEGSVLLLCSIDDACFNPCQPLQGNLVVTKIDDDKNLELELMKSLMTGEACVRSAAISAPFNEQRWCIFNTMSPTVSLKQPVFWTQLMV